MRIAACKKCGRNNREPGEGPNREEQRINGIKWHRVVCLCGNRGSDGRDVEDGIQLWNIVQEN